MTDDFEVGGIRNTVFHIRNISHVIVRVIVGSLSVPANLRDNLVHMQSELTVNIMVVYLV